jgi:hypothetical protein
MSEMRIVGVEELDLQFLCQAHRGPANRPVDRSFPREKSVGSEPIRRQSKLPQPVGPGRFFPET